MKTQAFDGASCLGITTAFVGKTEIDGKLVGTVDGSGEGAEWKEILFVGTGEICEFEITVGIIE